MFTKRNGLVHEQVASIMRGMGLIIEDANADPSNNRRFVNEGVNGIAGLVTEESSCGGDDKGDDDMPPKKGKKSVQKKDKDGKPMVGKDGKPVMEEVDETDGEPDYSTDVNNDPANPKAATKPKHTSTKVDADAGKQGAGGKVNEGSIEEAAAAFYDGLNKPVTFVIYENDEAEVFGLTNEDVAPFGGTAPCMPTEFVKQAKDGGSNKKGDVGVLMLYSTKGMDERTKKILTAQQFRASGWATPAKGSGMKVTIPK